MPTIWWLRHWHNASEMTIHEHHSVLQNFCHCSLLTWMLWGWVLLCVECGSLRHSATSAAYGKSSLGQAERNPAPHPMLLQHTFPTYIYNQHNKLMTKIQFLAQRFHASILECPCFTCRGYTVLNKMVRHSWMVTRQELGKKSWPFTINYLGIHLYRLRETWNTSASASNILHKSQNRYLQSTSPRCWN